MGDLIMEIAGVVLLLALIYCASTGVALLMLDITAACAERERPDLSVIVPRAMSWPVEVYRYLCGILDEEDEQ